MVSKRGKLRNTVIQKSVSGLVSSGLVRCTAVLVGCIICIILTGNLFLLLIPIFLLSYYIKSIVFEVLVLEYIIESSLGLRDWYNYVDDDLYLGAIPMESMDHKSHLALDLKVEAVLSILEDYEFRCITLSGRPVQPDEWKREDMDHLQLNSFDFYPPSFEILDQGADWINSYLIKGKKVYCHCKAGVGRSASVVIAYFMKYKKMSAVAAYEELKSRRSIIFGVNSSQMKNMLAYEKSRRTYS